MTGPLAPDPNRRGGAPQPWRRCHQSRPKIR